MNSTQLGIPDGYHALTPYLIVRDADQAISFYQQAFDAVELKRSEDSSGIVRNIEFKIGDSPFMLGIHPDMPPVNEQKSGDLPRLSIYLYCEDADQVFDQAISQGATVLYRPQDQDYGNREGGLTDPFGITWWIATQLATTTTEIGT